MRRIGNIGAILMILALLIVGLIPGIASASTIKDYYNTGFDGNNTFTDYGDSVRICHLAFKNIKEACYAQVW